MNERQPTEEEIERVRRSIMEAPKTESGIVLPPHVAEAVKQVGQGIHVAMEEVQVGPNRAQRRANAKQERRWRRQEERRARMTAEQQTALRNAEKALEAVPEALRPAAMGMLKQLAAMTPEQRAEKLRELEAPDAA